VATRVCLWTGHAAIGEGADETWPPELDAARAITAVGDGEEMSHTVARERERDGTSRVPKTRDPFIRGSR
jgi:hypothetical protein